jgi:hypothetical protein
MAVKSVSGERYQTARRPEVIFGEIKDTALCDSGNDRGPIDRPTDATATTRSEDRADGRATGPNKPLVNLLPRRNDGV